MEINLFNLNGFLNCGGSSWGGSTAINFHKFSAKKVVFNVSISTARKLVAKLINFLIYIAPKFIKFPKTDKIKTVPVNNYIFVN